MNDISAPSASAWANELAKEYIDHKIDSIELITTRYQNMMTYKVEDWTLLPAICEEKGVKKFHDKHNEQNHNEHHIDALMDFEPSAEAILATVVPMYLANIIYQAMLEASASELASRVSAMSAATDNARDMIEQLTIVYNKKRQEKITDEIIEIVSGANAL
jgi:F-type H+-transporting ATPase subunit gamma